MTRFLHTADWQTGRRYSQFSPEDSSSCQNHQPIAHKGLVDSFVASYDSIPDSVEPQFSFKVVGNSFPQDGLVVAKLKNTFLDSLIQAHTSIFQ